MTQPISIRNLNDIIFDDELLDDAFNVDETDEEIINMFAANVYMIVAVAQNLDFNQLDENVIYNSYFDNPDIDENIAFAYNHSVIALAENDNEKTPIQFVK